MNHILQRYKNEIIISLLSLIFGITLYILPTNANAKLFLGLAALPVILWKFEIGLYMAVLALPFVNFKYTALLIYYTFISFVIKNIYNREQSRTTNLDGSLLLFFIVLLFSSVFSITLVQSLKELFLYTSIILMAIMIGKGFDRKKLNYLLLFLVVSATLVSLIGIYQYSNGIVGHHAWVDVESNPNLKARAFSTMDNPNILAEYLVITCSLSIALFINSKNMFRKILLAIITSITLLCLIFTFSRGGWLGFAVSIFIILLYEEKRILPMAMLFGAVSLFFLPDVVIDRIKTIGSLKDTSNAYRFLIWSASTRMFRDFWPCGVGLGYGAFIKAYPNYTLAGIKAAHSHNLYLQIAIETGILGLIIFMYNIFKTYAMGIYIALKGEKCFLRRISIASLGAISGLLLHGLVEHVLFDYRIIFSFWLTIGIVLASYKEVLLEPIN